MKYLPSGTPVFEITLAVPQRHFEKTSLGYFEVVFCGKDAEEVSGHYIIGKKIKVNGSLWMRNYRNRQGVKITENKIIVETIEGESK